MGFIKPSINAKGYKKVLNEYSQPSVIEELAANSYDAYASTVLLLLDDEENKLYVMDDGNGFNNSEMQQVLTLGGGGKKFAAAGERIFLGSYGFGLKSVLNIAHSIIIRSCCPKEFTKYTANIDLNIFDHMLWGDNNGYPYDAIKLPKPKRSKGTIIELSLTESTSETELNKYGQGLSNLPNHDGKFKCYYGLFNDEVKSKVSAFQKTFTGLKEIVSELYDSKKLKLASVNGDELSKCAIETIFDKDDPDVKAVIYFRGMNEGKVIPLGDIYRGVYVRVNGRLLKYNFSNDEYTGVISKYIMFKSAMRVELYVDWLMSEVTLSRDGVRFSTKKREEDFKKVVVKLIGKFTRAQFQKLERLKERATALKLNRRIELANKRISHSDETVIKGRKMGFAFRPETDAELAILIAQNKIMNKINPSYKLIDYNAQENFDCMLYDEKKGEFIFTELEPHLTDFLKHRNKEYIKQIIVWSLGKWRVGFSKKGYGGAFKLEHPNESPQGNYKLFQYTSKKIADRTPDKWKYDFDVIVLEEILH